MQDIPNLLKKMIEVDSTLIKSISEINDKLDIHTDTLVGFGASQTWTNILVGGLIIVGILVIIIRKK